MKDDEELKALGALATKCAHIVARVPGRTSFGLVRRYVDRQTGKLAQQGFWERTKGQDEIDRAALIANEGELLEAGKLAESIALARKQFRLDKAEEKSKLEEHVAVLKQFAAKHERQHLDTLTSFLPLVPRFLANMRSVPLPGGVCVCLPSTPCHDATQALAFAEHHRVTNVASELEKEWHTLHEMVSHSTCEPIVDANSSLSRCAIHGVCVCSVAGKRLWRFRNFILRAMKNTFGAKQKQQKLMSGYIVLCLREEAEASTEPLVHYYHVGLMFLRPYRPTFQRLEQVFDTTQATVASGHRHILK
eukprot:2372506-Amphidinium_carterae.1